METASHRYCGYGNCISNQCAVVFCRFAELSEEHHATCWGVTDCKPVKHGLRRFRGINLLGIIFWAFEF